MVAELKEVVLEVIECKFNMFNQGAHNPSVGIGVDLSCVIDKMNGRDFGQLIGSDRYEFVLREKRVQKSCSAVMQNEEKVKCEPLNDLPTTKPDIFW